MTLPYWFHINSGGLLKFRVAIEIKVTSFEGSKTPLIGISRKKVQNPKKVLQFLKI